MKITLNVDEGLLHSVMHTAGTTNKTKAIDLALREYARRAELLRLAKKGTGLSPAELKKSVDPNYDIVSARVAEIKALYGRKNPAR